MTQKRGTKSTATNPERDFSSQFFQDEDVQLLKDTLSTLKKRYALTTADVLNLAQDELLVPGTIFIKKLSPLEALAKYLKENQKLEYSEIEKLLGRDRKTIWQAHKNAIKKLPEAFKPTETEYAIPISVFKSDLSILEAVVTYLKEHFKISYHQIGELIERNERTVWTVHDRAKKKHG